MRTRVLLSLAVFSLVITTGCNNGRSRAKLDRVDRTIGNATQEWDYRYADSGLLEELRIQSGGATDTWEVTYNDSNQVEELRRERENTDDLVYEYTYDDGQLTEKRETQGGDFNADTDLEYDSNGRITGAVKTTHIGETTTITVTTELDYDNDGRLELWTQTTHSRTEIIIVLETTEIEEREFRYSDEGYLEEIQVSIGGDGDSQQSYDVEYEYEDSGRLAELFDANGDRANFDYDDQGRVEEVDYPDENDRYEFSYDDGNASGAQIEPLGVPFGTFFDLEGRSFNGFDLNSFFLLQGL